MFKFLFSIAIVTLTAQSYAASYSFKLGKFSLSGRGTYSVNMLNSDNTYYLVTASSEVSSKIEIIRQKAISQGGLIEFIAEGSELSREAAYRHPRIPGSANRLIIKVLIYKVI